MGHLNINRLRNKFEIIKEVFFNNIDVFFLSETKAGETFPSNQFQIERYKISDWTETVIGEVFACMSTKI